MSIECYYEQCKHHSKDGPFCDEQDCLATVKELAYFARIREEYLKRARAERFYNDDAED